MVICGKSLNKVVGEAMATILAAEKYILEQDFNQCKINLIQIMLSILIKHLSVKVVHK